MRLKPIKNNGLTLHYHTKKLIVFCTTGRGKSENQCLTLKALQAKAFNYFSSEIAIYNIASLYPLQHKG